MLGSSRLSNAWPRSRVIILLVFCENLIVFVVRVARVRMKMNVRIEVQEEP